MEKILSTDNTDETTFHGDLDRMIYKFVKMGSVNKIPGQLLGTKTFDGEDITIEHLLGNSNIEFDTNMVGIYLPSDEILKRRKYNWFVRSNKVQILSSNTNAGKFFTYGYNN